MARIRLISREEAPPEVKEIYEKTLRGKPGNVQKAVERTGYASARFLQARGSRFGAHESVTLRAEATVDRTAFDMTWSPMKIAAPHSDVVVTARFVRN